MNKLKTNINGGFPLELDDIRFEQDAVREAFSGLIGALGSQSYVISGCTVTDNVTYYSIAAGFIALNGEVCRVDAHTINKTVGHTYYWVVQSSYDPAGNEPFENATTQDTYEIRKAIVTSSVSVPMGFVSMNVQNFSAKVRALPDVAAIEAKIDGVLAAWSNIYPSHNNTDFAGRSALGGGWNDADWDVPNAPVRAKYKKNGKTIHLQIAFKGVASTIANGASQIALLNLPFIAAEDAFGVAGVGSLQANGFFAGTNKKAICHVRQGVDVLYIQLDDLTALGNGVYDAIYASITFECT